ncbi:hypothetical protein BGZ46_005706 [Entomortierella lignicola]|nr:hypothetical protein BGZ46_005706 [Entomortierella lignicola]
MSEARRNLSSSAIIDNKVEYARGAFKMVYKGKYTEGSRTGQDCVCKVFISGSVYEKSFFQHEMDVVSKATDIVRGFNALGALDKKIIINQPEIWQFQYGDQALNLIEPMIDNFEKFNSNSGWVQNTTPWGKAMQALTHFSYHHSGGQFALCDLQGGIYSDGLILTDPVVMSRDGRFGPTDLGKDGIENFFALHTCSNYCRSSWSRPANRNQIFQPIKGTTMMQVQTQLGRYPLSRQY